MTGLSIPSFDRYPAAGRRGGEHPPRLELRKSPPASLLGMVV